MQERKPHSKLLATKIAAYAMSVNDDSQENFVYTLLWHISSGKKLFVSYFQCFVQH